MHRLFTVLALAALAALAGCGDDFEVTISTEACVGTTPRLSWTTNKPGVSWVEYGFDESLGLSTPISTEEGTEHSFTLLGTPPLTEVHYRAITEVGGKQREASGVTATAGLPADLPDFQVTVYDPELASPEPWVLGTAFGTIPAVYAVDREGNWVWYRRVSPEKNPIELAFEQSTGDVLFNSFLTDHGEDDSTVTRISFDCSTDEDVHTPLGHHAFTQLPDGSLAYLAIDVRDAEVDGLGEVSVVGDSVEVLTPEGEQYTLWSGWDLYEPAWHDGWDSAFYPQGGDWTHANALHYSAERDSLLMSFRNLRTIVELEFQDDGSVEVGRQFGGEGGYGFAEGTREFNYQHDPNFTEGGTILMITTDEEDETTAVEYEIDDDQELLTEIWSHGDGEGLYVLVQGTARELSNGNRMVNFGSSGLVREVTPDGDVAWEMSALAGAAFGNTVPFDDLYDPLLGSSE